MKNIWVFYQDGGTPAQGWGDRHYFMSKHYDKSRYKATIFSANQCHMYTEPVNFSGNFWVTSYKGIDYCWVKVNAYSKANSLKRIISWFLFTFKLFFLPKQKLGIPDIIVVSSMPMFPILPALYFKYRYGVKIIFEVRDIWPLTILQMGGYKKGHPFVLLMRAIEKIAYRYSDYLVSVLDKAYLHFEKSTNRKFRFQWISNGIDEEVLMKESDCIELMPNKKFIVGYAGKMNISNAVEFIVDTAIQLKDNQNIHFVFIGDGDEKDALIERAQGLSNITFIAKVKKHELHSLVKRFNVAIISFRKLDVYKFGVSTNKLFDYLMAGVPILMASSYEHEAYTQSGAVLRVEAEDVEAMADAITSLANSPAEDVKKIGLLGRDFASNNFTFKQLAKRYEQIFDSLD